MTDFRQGEQAWIDRLGNLRNVIRQELVRRQVAANLSGVGTVLDVGCGQGTQALHLLAAEHSVTAIDQSPELLALFAADAEAAGFKPELIHGTLASAGDLVLGRTSDLVCAHGLLMYLPDTGEALVRLSRWFGSQLHVIARRRQVS